MGWNSWNKFYCGINETLIKSTADVIISSGLAKLGYTYINLDDCWQLTRDANTKEIQADPRTFPSGMKSLGDYLHSKGLKFGLYSDAGTKTCQERPGGLFYEDIDAQTYAKWGVDYLKYDNCFNMDIPPKWRYPRMRNALNKTGRPIFYSLCEWGQDDPWNWASNVGNSWRTTGDIEDKWSSVITIIELQSKFSSAGAPGGWNDPDMLEVGNGGMTTTEYQTHFALWALMKAPLLIGCDVTNMSKDTFTILSNQELIAVNQDSLGIPATRLLNATDHQVWGGRVEGGFVVAVMNTGTDGRIITTPFTLFNLTGAQLIRDLISHKDLGSFEDSFQAKVDSHGVVVVKLSTAKIEESLSSILE